MTYRLEGEEIGEDALPIASFWVPFEGENRISSYRPQTGKSRRGERAVTFYEEPMPCNNEYNGYTYIDTMNRAATERFFRLTHEKYRAALGDLFGREIKGIFTDEPAPRCCLQRLRRHGEIQRAENPLHARAVGEVFRALGR